MPIDLDWPESLRWSPPGDPGLVLRRLDPDADAPRLQRWFSRPEAHFWGLQQHDVLAVRELYHGMLACGHALALVGECDGEPSLVVECYEPSRDAIATHYPVRPGDCGMHFFVAPAERPQHGFTRRLFRGLMQALFSCLGAQRIVVEPDIRNHKVHVLNAAMGFEAAGPIVLPHKTALLSLCTAAQFERATASLPSFRQPETA
jgi:RimJ/RimL family protein N-acetyltransferase